MISLQRLTNLLAGSISEECMIKDCFWTTYLRVILIVFPDFTTLQFCRWLVSCLFELLCRRGALTVETWRGRQISVVGAVILTFNDAVQALAYSYSWTSSWANKSALAPIWNAKATILKRRYFNRFFIIIARKGRKFYEKAIKNIIKLFYPVL